jgi:thiamine-monophosphate kinase
LSLGLPRKLSQSWVDRFMSGLLKLAGGFGVTLAGGDTSESPGGVLADIVVVGSVPRAKAILRSDARAGDRIYVTGELGGAAAAVGEFLNGGRRKLRPREYPRFFYPTPRLEVGRVLREKNLVSAMIDLSDGLSTDLGHICEESKVGAEIQAEAIPLATVGRSGHEVDLRLALHGGEDYELLFTAPAGKRLPARIHGVPVTQIGYVTHRKRLILMNHDGAGYELKTAGWEHFRK